MTAQYITNATLSSLDGWTATHTKTTETNDPADAFTKSTQGNNTVGYATEAYAGWGSLIQTAYSMKQTITLPAGNYRLVNYSFYRQGGGATDNPSKSLAYLVAGEQKVALKTLGSITAAGYANSQAEGANVFDSKMYRNVIEFSIAADNTPIEIGVEGTFDEAKCWCIVGQFELFDLDDLASVSSPTDMTYAITNPGFEYRDLTGWTNNDNFWYPSDANINNFNHIGNGWIEKWAGSNFPNATLSQTLTNIPNGLYEVTVLAQARGGSGFYVFANNEKTPITDRGDYSVRATVTDGTLTLGVKTISFAGDWTPFDNFHLQFYGDPLAAYQDLLDAAVTDAQTYINSNPALSAAHIAALQSIVDANDNDDNAFTEESQFTTAIETINAAVETYKAMVTPYAKFNALKTSADEIANVEYTEITNGSHTTFTGAITAQTTAADNATSAADINSAISTLTGAVKTYIAGAEPKNDGEYFDITCLMVNPNFDDSHNGWTYVDAPGVNWSNCEYYEKEFDINQTVTGLPNGSYSLSVQAFQRPGWAANVYNDYIDGKDNASSVLYINSITSNVKNIAAEAQSTYKLGDGSSFDWPNDSRVGAEGSYKYVPNSQQGAKLYFEAGLYDATCAAVVDDAANGSLTLGFKSTKTHVSGDWTIFDNFRLYYYGSSKMIYYKQYLPQLEAEIAENYLNNAAYAVLKDGQTERAALATANSVDAKLLSTEAELQNAIDAITTARDAFAAAKTAYDNLALVLASNTYNIGDGVFQMSAAQASTFNNAVTDGTTMYQTGTAGVQDVTTQIYTISNAYVLNAPVASKRYKLTLSGKGALTFKTGGQDGEGGYENPFMDANDNLAQHFTLTKVQSASNPNIFTLCFVDLEGNTRYVCAGEKAKAGLGNERIRTTTTAADALPILVIATTTNGEFNMYNTLTNSKLGSNGGGLYTTNDITIWSIAEASQASIAINTSAAGYGTLILPFAADLPADVKAYTCAAYSGDQLTLVEATEIEANKPYIIEGSWNETKTGWGLGAAVDNTVGLLTGVYAEKDAPVGSYVMQKNNDKVGFYKVADGKQPKVGANRCYVTVPDPSRAAFFFNTDATGIEAIEALTNGEVEIFNAAGARVPALQKGMNIIRKANGKSYKVIVK